MKSEKKKKIFIDPDVMTWCWYFSPPHPPQPMAIYCLMKTADYLLINTVCIFFMTLYLWLSWVVIIIMKLYSGLVWSSFFFRISHKCCNVWQMNPCLAENICFDTLTLDSTCCICTLFFTIQEFLDEKLIYIWILNNMTYRVLLS